MTGFLDLPSEPIVRVFTEDERGHSPETITELCVDRIMCVSENAPPVIRDQAQAFKESLKPLVLQYIKKAVQSDRVTLYNILAKNGNREAAEIIRRL